MVAGEKLGRAAAVERGAGTDRIEHHLGTGVAGNSHGLAIPQGRPVHDTTPHLDALLAHAAIIGMYERPHRAIADLQASLSQLGDQSAKGQVTTLTAFQQPLAMATDDLPGPMTTHPRRRNAPGRAEALYPDDRRLNAYAISLGCRSSRQAFPLHRPDNPFAKIHRIWSRHSGWPSTPATMLNQISRFLGIPYRFRPKSSRSRNSPAEDSNRSTHRPREGQPVRWLPARLRSSLRGRGR